MRKLTPLRPIDLALAAQSVAHQPGEDLTLSELARAFGAAKCDDTELRLRKWLRAFGDRSAWSLTSEELEAAAQAMVEHGYAPATANRDLSGLGSVYKWARDRRLSPRGFKSPTLSIRRFDEPIRRVHVEREQVDRLLAAAWGFSDRRFGVFVALLMETGARKSEILERTWADVDLERREILAPTTKNGTPRVLFFSEKAAELIRRVFPKRDPDGLIFEGRVPGQPICYRRAWVELTRSVGLPDLHMHDLRHVAAANLLRAGVTLGVAAQVLGHDPAVLARRYGHLETNALRRAQELAWT